MKEKITVRQDGQQFYRDDLLDDVPCLLFEGAAHIGDYDLPGAKAARQDFLYWAARAKPDWVIEWSV